MSYKEFRKVLNNAEDKLVMYLATVGLANKWQDEMAEEEATKRGLWK